jgi:pyruvate dehydrogenase E2 component (dihydrolipoamide acetyltransferase)
MVPVVRDAHTKRVAELAAETRDLARRCRDGTITPPELEGSVITISNLGMFGIDRFAAVINPPEAAILAVGRAKPTAVVVDGEIRVRDVMTITLSVDHRVLYGAEAAAFLGRVAERLEHPGALVL